MSTIELLIPADVEVASLDHVSLHLPDHGFPNVTKAKGTLGTKLPKRNPKPPEFGRLFSTGGPPRDLVTDSPTLVVEGYAEQEQRARDLCALMVAIIEAAGRSGTLGTEIVYRARATSLPGNLPHPQVPSHFRFTAMISVDLRRKTA